MHATWTGDVRNLEGCSSSESFLERRFAPWLIYLICLLRVRRKKVGDCSHGAQSGPAQWETGGSGLVARNQVTYGLNRKPLPESLRMPKCRRCHEGAEMPVAPGYGAGQVRTAVTVTEGTVRSESGAGRGHRDPGPPFRVPDFKFKLPRPGPGTGTGPPTPGGRPRPRRSAVIGGQAALPWALQLDSGLKAPVGTGQCGVPTRTGLEPRRR